MPLRHGTHHGISFIVGIFLSVLLGEVFRRAMPGFFSFVDNFSQFIINTFNIPFTPDTMSKLMLAFIIVILYGIAFGTVEKVKHKAR